MTTPDERTKSFRWAHELLCELVDSSDVDDQVRANACAIAYEFPTPEALAALVASGAERLPVRTASAIEAALAFFAEIRGSVTLPAPIRSGLIYALRHFPSAGWATGAARNGFAGGIDSWLSRSQDDRPWPSRSELR